jgi:hypothetical protein
MRSRPAAAVILLAIVSATVGSAAALPNGLITGRVTSETGEPLEGVCVSTSEPIGTGFAWTNAQGRYTMSVSPGRYRVHFADCSHGLYFDEWYNDKLDYTSADPVLVLPGVPSGGIDAALRRGGSVSGTVTDEAGHPLEGICVSVFNAHGAALALAATDASGAYVVGILLPSDRVDVLVRFGDDPGFAEPIYAAGAPLSWYAPYCDTRFLPEWYDDRSDSAHADSIPVTIGVDTPHIDAALAPAGILSGRVTNADGAGLPGICALAFLSPDTSSQGVQTDYEGGYDIGRLVPGDYRVEFFDCHDAGYRGEWFDDRLSFEEADLVRVVGGARTGGIDAVLERRLRPDLAVVGLRVENLPIRTDDLEVGHSGTQRRVHVEVANLGDAPTPPHGAALVVFMRTASDNNERTIGVSSLRLAPGEKVRKTFDWDGTGSVGDATVYAEVCNFDDSNSENNRASVRHYVIVGGTGVGLTPVEVNRPGNPQFGRCFDIFS